MSKGKRVLQTISELGLEKGTAAVWCEPRQARFLRSRHGNRYIPWKWILAVVVSFGTIAALYSKKSGAISNVLLTEFLVVSIFCVVGTVLLLASLDYISNKNVWVYSDAILRTHSSTRELYRFSDVANAVVYSVAMKDVPYVLELVFYSGRSVPIGVSSSVTIYELIEILRFSGVIVHVES